MYNVHGRKAAGTAAHCSQVVWVSKIRGFIIPNSRSWLYAEWCFCIILLHMLFLQWWWHLCFCQACRNGSIVSFPSISSFLSIAFPKFLETLKYFDNLAYILKVGISGIRDSANFFHFPPKFRLRTRKLDRVFGGRNKWHFISLANNSDSVVTKRLRGVEPTLPFYV